MPYFCVFFLAQWWLILIAWNNENSYLRGY